MMGTFSGTRDLRLAPNSSPAEVRATLGAKMQAGWAAIQATKSEIQALGPPPVPDGHAIHTELVSVFGQMEAAFPQVITAIQGIPDDPAAAGPYMARVALQIENPFDAIEQRFPQVIATLEANEPANC